MPSDWPLTPDGQYYQAEGKILLPVDPDGVAVVMLKPFGVGIGSGITAIEKGDPGVPANIDETVNYTELAASDPTAASSSWTTLTPPTETTPGLYRLNLSVHAGATGADGASVWDPTDLDPTPVAGQIPVVDSAATGFELVAQKIPEVFYPGSVSNTASGNPNSTVSTIPIPSRPWARRVRGIGFTIVTGEATDVRVNLLARLNNETGGNIIGRCIGIAQTERLTLTPGKPIETGTVADSYDQIAANASATVYIRCERTAGTLTYTTSASMTQFYAETTPI